MCFICELIEGTDSTPYITLSALLYTWENGEGFLEFINELDPEDPAYDRELDASDLEYIKGVLGRLIIRLRDRLQRDDMREKGSRGLN